MPNKWSVGYPVTNRPFIGHCKLAGSMWPASNGDRRARVDGSGRLCLPLAAQKETPLPLQATAVNDVNEINVCGQWPHTLISLTSSPVAGTVDLVASQRSQRQYSHLTGIQMERGTACIQNA